MSAKYLIRMDDISPFMRKDRFTEFINIFEKYGIVPLLGVIPDNKDEKLVANRSEDFLFWTMLQSYVNTQKISVCMHGVFHRYINKEGGILNRTNASEFVGLPVDVQCSMIKHGKDILINHGIKDIDIFMAPSHSFDLNTLEALALNGFKFLTDGIGLFPYVINNMVMLPQQIYFPRLFPVGYFTICIHSDVEPDSYLKTLTQFIEKNHSKFISFEQYIHEVCNNLDSLSWRAMNYLFKSTYEKAIFFRKAFERL